MFNPLEWHYPRVGCIATNDPQSHTPEGQARTARFNYAAHSKDPPVIEGVHQANPQCAVFFEWMPQFCPSSDKWTQYPWNLKNYVRHEAERWGWLLLQANGQEIKTWGWSWLNFTSQCPKNDKGQTVAQWLPGIIKEWMIDGGEEGWGPWGRPNQYDGLEFDLIFETIWDGWLGNQRPDYNGSADQFRQDWLTTTRQFCNALKDTLPEAYLIQAGGDKNAPWVGYFAGLKQEDFLIRDSDWGAEYQGVDAKKRGLLYVERQIGTNILTLAQTRVDTETLSSDAVDKWVRYTLGTTLLTEAIYICVASKETGSGLCSNVQQPFWHPLYDLDFGTWGGEVEAYANGVHVREFWETESAAELLPPIGRVIVNSSSEPQGGIPAQDALFQSYQRDWVRVFVDIFTDKHAKGPEVAEASWVESGIRTADPEAIEALCRRELGL